jgi:hypothetical protein
LRDEIAIFCLAFVGWLAIAEAAPKRHVTRDMALEAITVFRVDPTSERGRAAGGVIFEFVENSPEVLVNITKRLCLFSAMRRFRYQ